MWLHTFCIYSPVAAEKMPDASQPLHRCEPRCVDLRSCLRISASSGFTCMCAELLLTLSLTLLLKSWMLQPVSRLRWAHGVQYS